MRQKRYKGKSIWKLFRTRGLPVLVLFAVFSLMYGITVFSFGDGDKYIEFAGEKWNVKEDDPQKVWYTNEDEITFTVDLTEDYEAHKKSGEEPEELPPPFYITAVHGDTELNVREPEPIGPEFTGKYEITAQLQANDGEANFTITFPRETWAKSEEKALIAGFTIVKDKTSPQATYMINGDTNLKNKYKDNVELKFETEEDVILFINGQAQTGYQKAGSVTLTENGEYDVYVLDRAGNKGTEISFAIAKDDPAMTVTKDGKTIEDGDAVASGTLQFQVKLAIPIKNASITVTKDGQPVKVQLKQKTSNTRTWTGDFTEDGTYTAEISASDRFDNYHYTFSFTVDGTGPAITINGAEPNAKYNEAKEITIEIDDPNGLKSIPNPEATRTDLNNETKSYGKFNNQNGIFKQTFDQDGRYTITVSAEDNVGNKSTKTLTFIIDQSAPALTASVKNNKHYNIDEVTLTVKDYTPVETKARLIHEATQTETELTFEKKDDFTAKATAALPQENGNVLEGQYKIVWEAADAFENKAEKTITFTVDRTVPALSIKANGAPLTDGQYFKDNTTITVQVDDDNFNKDKTTLVVKHDGKAIQVPAPDKNGRLEFTLKENGRYEITLNAEDEAGNKAEPIKVSFTIDKDLPELSIIGVDNNGYYPEAEVHVKATDLTLKQARLVYEFNGETEEIPLTWQSAREAVATALFEKKPAANSPETADRPIFARRAVILSSLRQVTMPETAKRP